METDTFPGSKSSARESVTLDKENRVGGGTVAERVPEAGAKAKGRVEAGAGARGGVETDAHTGPLTGAKGGSGF